jgi:hypothetical protein
VLGNDFGLGALGVIQCLYVPLITPFVGPINSHLIASAHSIGAAILSHHVDTFALVSAFFLFSIGCLNILVGLIWRERAKSKRSLLSWRDKPVSVLPTHVAPTSVRVDVQTEPTLGRFMSTRTVNEKVEEEDGRGSKAGYGFGRQGEKAAALKGSSISGPSDVVY